MTRREPIREIRTVGLTGEFVYRYWPQIRYLAQYTPDRHAMQLNLIPSSPASVLGRPDPGLPVDSLLVYLTVRFHFQQEPGARIHRWLSVAPQSERDEELLARWELEHWAGAY